MTKPGFPDKVRVEASTSPVFPVGSEVLFDRVEPKPRARIILRREGEEPQVLFEKDLPEKPEPGKDLFIRNEIEIEVENGREKKKLLLVITVCPGRGPEPIRKFLVGQVSDVNDIDTGGTGVWVAEAGPPTQGE